MISNEVELSGYRETKREDKCYQNITMQNSNITTPVSVIDDQKDSGFASNQTFASKRRKLFCSLKFSLLGHKWLAEVTSDSSFFISFKVDSKVINCKNKDLASMIFEQIFFQEFVILAKFYLL